MEISVREDRRQMLMNMLLIERVYVALDYHAVPYKHRAYFTSETYVKRRMEELRNLCKEHKLVITERLLSHAIKHGANDITLKVEQ